MHADKCQLWHSKSDGPCRTDERTNISIMRPIVSFEKFFVCLSPSIRNFKCDANHDVEIIRFNQVKPSAGEKYLGLFAQKLLLPYYEVKPL